MGRRNHVQQDPRMRPDPFAGIGGDIPLIDPNRANQNAPKAEQMMAPADGTLHEPDWVPLGQMLICQIVNTSDARTLQGGVEVPQWVDWITPTYVVLAAGADCKWIKKHDHVYVSPQVKPSVVRVIKDGETVQTLYVHEEQCFGYVRAVREKNDTRVLGTAGEGTEETAESVG